MSAKVYSFAEQKVVGDEGEKAIDQLYSGIYDIVPPKEKLLQGFGVDRLFKDKSASLACWFSVEYKTDHVAHRTGNVFVEISITTPEGRILGWAQKLFAQALIYYVPGNKTCYFASSLHLKEQIAQWQLSCKVAKPVINVNQDGTEYCALGILVPINRFIDDCCSRVDKIVEEDDSSFGT